MVPHCSNSTRISALVQTNSSRFVPLLVFAKQMLSKVLCFYRDHSAETPNSGPEESEIDWQLVKEHTQRKSRTPWGQLPCSYRLLADHMQQMAHPSVGGAHPMGCGSAELRLGQSVIHSWECDSGRFAFAVMCAACHQPHRLQTNSTCTSPSSSTPASSNPPTIAAALAKC